MVTFLYFIGSIFVLLGLATIFFPRETRNFSFSLWQGVPLFVWGAIFLILGTIFWFANTAMLSPCIVRTLALICWFKGIFILLVPGEDTEKLMNAWKDFSLVSVRIIGVLWLIFSIYFLLRIG